MINLNIKKSNHSDTSINNILSNIMKSNIYSTSFYNAMSFKKLFLAILFIISSNAFVFSQTKILFDNTRGETASNSDWVIDADVRNLNSNWPTTTGGTEGNAQTTPTPAQSAITTGRITNESD